MLYLLSTWWYRVNWLVAYSYGGMGESLPPGFSALTLASLRSLPVTKRIDFEKFADQLIQTSGLTWTAPDMSFAPMLLHGAVERMILAILENFGAVELEYQDKPLGKGTIRERVAFQVTPFGQQLLEALTAPERAPVLPMSLGSSLEKQMKTTIDDYDKAMDLLHKMEVQLPIPARPGSALVRSMEEQRVFLAHNQKLPIESVLYAGDEGGIMCNITSPDMRETPILCSLTHIRVDPNHPLAGEIRAYQEERVRKLAQQPGPRRPFSFTIEPRPKRRR